MTEETNFLRGAASSGLSYMASKKYLEDQENEYRPYIKDSLYRQGLFCIENILKHMVRLERKETSQDIKKKYNHNIVGLFNELNLESPEELSNIFEMYQKKQTDYKGDIGFHCLGEADKSAKDPLGDVLRNDPIIQLMDNVLVDLVNETENPNNHVYLHILKYIFPKKNKGVKS